MRQVEQKWSAVIIYCQPGENCVIPKMLKQLRALSGGAVFTAG